MAAQSIQRTGCHEGPTIHFDRPRAGTPAPSPHSFPGWAAAQGPFIELENFGISRHFLMMDAHKLLMLLVLILSLHVISSNRVDPYHVDPLLYH